MVGMSGVHRGDSEEVSRPERFGPSVQKKVEAAKGNLSRRHVAFQMAVVLPESQSRCHSVAA